MLKLEIIFPILISHCTLNQNVSSSATIEAEYHGGLGNVGLVGEILGWMQGLLFRNREGSKVGAWVFYGLVNGKRMSATVLNKNTVFQDGICKQNTQQEHSFFLLLHNIW